MSREAFSRLEERSWHTAAALPSCHPAVNAAVILWYFHQIKLANKCQQSCNRHTQNQCGKQRELDKIYIGHAIFVSNFKRLGREKYYKNFAKYLQSRPVERTRHVFICNFFSGSSDFIQKNWFSFFTTKSMPLAYVAPHIFATIITNVEYHYLL